MVSDIIVISAAAARPKGTTRATLLSGGVNPVNANAHAIAVTPSSGALEASRPRPSANTAATYEIGRPR